MATHVTERRNPRPRKRLGQHFLTNPDILNAIADAADLRADDVVVEVGAGLGTLTTVLAARAGRILAVEVDPTLVDRLYNILAPYPNVRLLHQDILRLHLDKELEALGWTGSYKVVANLPYYITTPILRYFFAQVRRPTTIVVTVQQEVARRMVAQPPEMSFLSVLVQYYGQVQIVRSIPAGAFYPPPKVDSAVVRVLLYPQTPLPASSSDQFLRLVSVGFSQPRKQIHNPLSQGLGVSRQTIGAALAACGLDQRQRAETLSVADWLNLFRFLFPP